VRNVCDTGPGYDRCYQCNQVRSMAGIADLAVPLTYGTDGEQSHFLIRHSKGGQDAAWSVNV
jgi:hypothetical protein